MLNSKNTSRNFTQGSKKTQQEKEAEKKKRKRRCGNRIAELGEELEKKRKALIMGLRNVREEERQYRNGTENKKRQKIAYKNSARHWEKR